jgi:hypothetical protein
MKASTTSGGTIVPPAKPSSPSVRLTAWVVARITASESAYQSQYGTGPMKSSACVPGVICATKPRNAAPMSAVARNFVRARKPRLRPCRMPR